MSCVCNKTPDSISLFKSFNLNLLTPAGFVFMEATKGKLSFAVGAARDGVLTHLAYLQ